MYSIFGYVLDIIRGTILNLGLEIILGITSFATPRRQSGKLVG